MNELISTLQPNDIKSIKQAWSSSSSSLIRVGTVCSGTDAPILALKQLLSALNHDTNDDDAFTNMEMKHVFSCENVKFKRDFIQQTTNPPLIFNDLIKLATSLEGVCHDGSTNHMPTDDDLHILIAGTECKDFSSLSSSRKGINDNGKSGNTFWATHTLVKKLKPCIIILENVAQCPSKEMELAFEDIGYTAMHTKVCASDYYLPQSRSRAYFVFLNNDKARFRASFATDDWIETMARLAQKKGDVITSWTTYLDRNSNSPMPKKHSKKKAGGRGKPLCESLESAWLAEIKAIEKKEGLTPFDNPGGRPYSDATKSVEAIASLSDRAKMRLDVQCKRAMKAGVDPFKVPLIWNPAQQLRYTHTGIDNDGKPRMITPCVTPKHEWIVSSRMGPVTGAEALALQGIHVAKKVSSQFTSEQLRDLAGNAMSMTVVAAVFIATFLTTELIVDDNNSLKKRKPSRSAASVGFSATTEQRMKKRSRV